MILCGIMLLRLHDLVITVTQHGSKRRSRLTPKYHHTKPGGRTNVKPEQCCCETFSFQCRVVTKEESVAEPHKEEARGYSLAQSLSTILCNALETSSAILKSITERKPIAL